MKRYRSKSFAAAACLSCGSCGSQAVAERLASYEPSEIGKVVVTSPDAGVTLTWPVPGGVGGVPPATEGTSVLEVRWVGETDRKIDLRHFWPDLFFSLSNAHQVLLDVFVATPSAQPAIFGVFDQEFWSPEFGWVRGCEPLVTNEWTTVSIYVGDLPSEVRTQSVNGIQACVFEQLAGDDGKIYIDNLRLAATKPVHFAGHDWRPKNGCHIDPGSNRFSEGCASVDPVSGALHLSAGRTDGLWHSCELIGTQPLGFGRYVFTIETPVSQLDPNVILGFFTWDTNAPANHFREIDFEFGRWGDPEDPNAQYVVQPWNLAGNRHRFDILYDSGTTTTTHVLDWRPDGIDFLSYYGAFRQDPEPESIIQALSYAGTDNPPAGEETVRMNLWILPEADSAAAQAAEVVVADFRFLPGAPPIPALSAWAVAGLASLILAVGTALIRRDIRTRARLSN